MNTTGKNYQATSVGDIQAKGRVMLHNELALTGSEVSINELPPGVSVPFVHSHKRNEEVYIVVKGKDRAGRRRRGDRGRRVCGGHLESGNGRGRG